MRAKHKTIAVISLGCAKNLVNTEQMIFLLSEAGFEVTGETDGADVVVVNTCSFIESAKREAIDTILELGRAKEEGRIGRLVVAGCLPERYKSEILAELPEIDFVVGVGSFDEIVSVVGGVIAGDGAAGRKALFGDINAPVSETGRRLTTSPVWAYLKIAEGCDNRCAYCAIPDIRGRFRSRPFENIVKEAVSLADRGVRELILVAQDLTRYGLDMYGERRLPELLGRLSEIGGLKWIRLHYLYPSDVDDSLIDVISDNRKILNYLDIPFQHINDDILMRMNRRGGGEGIRDLLRRLRGRIPGLVLRTSLITGLPGEGDREFGELCEFVASAKIERAGIFAYSPEEGTAAAMMDRPDSDTAGRRKELLEDIQLRIMDEFNDSRIGSETEVLIEGFEDGIYYGRSFAESPDVDGYINIAGDGFQTNEFVNVYITGAVDGGLAGRATDNPQG